MSLGRRDFLAGSLAASIVGGRRSFGAWASMADANVPGPPIKSVNVDKPIKVADNQGDTWIAAWAGDDRLYSPSDDTGGFAKACNANVAFNRIDGNDPLHLTGTTINPMKEYGGGGERGPDGCTWKSMRCMWVDDALYLAVSRHLYGEESGDPKRRQTAENASIIRTTDFGKTWSRTARENYQNPMFGGRRFATPYFIQYGYGHAAVTADNADGYIYATSNNGFWDCGDDMVLGRVARSKLSALNGKDWEYYTGGDGMKPVSWSPKMWEATQLLVAPYQFGMTGAVYLPAMQRYFMIGWYYPAGGGKMPGAGTHTIWDFYESPRPWGPWTRIGSYDSTPSGLYSPEICPKFQSNDRVYALAAGYWEHPEDYRLTIVPVELQR